MKKLIITLLCIAILGGGGYFGFTKYKSSKDKKIVVDVVPVNLMAESADMYEYSNTTMDGQIISANSQKIELDNEKLVKKVLVKEGDPVKKGDTILEYDMTVVELEISQKENQVKVCEQNIKMAEKELAGYKTLKPSEDAPKEPEPDDYEPEEPEIPEEPEFPEDSEPIPDDSRPDIEEPEPIETTDVVTAAFKENNLGTKEDPYIINCNEKTKVSAAFLSRIFYTRKYAELCVYNENSEFLYKWIVNCENLTNGTFKEWVISNGISTDKETGMLSLDTKETHFGKFSVLLPASLKDKSENSDSGVDSIPDDVDDSAAEDEDYNDDYDNEDDYTDEDYDDDYTEPPQTPDTDPESEDYMYSRAEISKMIVEKEDEIKSLKLDLKSAKLDYEDALKKKTDGKVTAQIDGVVKKIGSAEDAVSGNETDNEYSDENQEYIDDEYYEDKYSDDSAFAIIEGEGGVSVSFNIGELNLDKAQEGASVMVTSYDTGAMIDAEVTKINTEPVSYTAYNWGDNPNSSTYTVEAKLSDSSDFNVDDWVSVSFSGTASESNSVYLPIHYVRQENGNYYIMKADDNNKLVKQYIATGKIMYGYSIEVKGGLSMKDRICFPYGKEVKEGVRTKDSTEVLYPEYY